MACFPTPHLLTLCLLTIPLSYCFNPNCPQPEQKSDRRCCATCGFDLWLGERYRAIAPLSSGGFGRTFLAEVMRPQQRACAIKQFHPQRSTPTRTGESFRKAAQLFHAEAERLAQLGRHPQIPRLYDHLEQDSFQYIVQEYIAGDNLEQELAQHGAFDEARIRQVLRELLPVLRYIHQHQVIHRDIKPQNIIRRDWQCQCAERNRAPHALVLVDFGAAKYATAATLARTGTLIGSAAYAAPEQVYGKASFASDLYSLGVTCIHLLTRIEPFDLYDSMENRLRWRDYLVRNAISEELGRVLDRLVANAVKERYPDAEAVMKDLGITSLPRSSSSLVKASPQSRRLLAYRKLTETNGTILSVAFSSDRFSLASGGGESWSFLTSKENSVRLWDIRDGTLRQVIKQNHPVVAVAYSGDGMLAGASDRLIRLWDNAGELKRTFKDHRGRVNAIAFSPDGLLLASGSNDQTVKLWSVGTGKCVATFAPENGGVQAVVFSPDGEVIAVGTEGTQITLWATYTGQKLRTLAGHLDTVEAIAFSPNGLLLASGGGDWDCTAKLWNVGTGEGIRTLGRDKGGIYDIAFTADGTGVAIAGSAIFIRETNTGNLRYTLRGHTGNIRAIALHPDGNILASGSEDETIRLWQLPD